MLPRRDDPHHRDGPSGLRLGRGHGRRRWSRRLVNGLLAAALAGAAPTLWPPTRPRAAPAQAQSRPYHTALVMTSEVGAIGDRVVTDGTVVVWADGSGALFAHNLADGRERRLLDGPARRSQLAIDRGTLVWVERSGVGAAIQGLRLWGGDPFTIAVGPGERNGPAVSGGVVVWRDSRNGNWDLYGYDLGTGQEFPLSTDPANVGAVSVAGEVVVWEDYRAGRWHLVGHNLGDRHEWALTAGPDDDTAPALGPDAVVFVRHRAGRSAGAIVLRDLRSGEERTIVEGHLALRPALAGALVVWEDWRDGVPNIYAYDRASGREFALTRSEQARGPAIAGSIVSWLSKGQFSSRVTTVRLVAALPSDPQDPPTVTDPNGRYFPESKHHLSGAFYQYWTLNGGLALFGFPLTEAFEETDTQGVKRLVQYFERARLEADPRDPARVGVARLGTELTQGRSFPTVAPFPLTATRVYVAQTQHSLGGWFKEYWEDNGGQELFGWPISEELVENGRVVQYFERARFELRPDAGEPRSSVLLGQLGREALVGRGWLPPPYPALPHPSEPHLEP